MMFDRLTRGLFVGIAAAGMSAAAFMQAPTSPAAAGVPGEWPAIAGNAQRDSWLRGDAYISRDAVEKGGFGLQWKLAMPAASRRPSSITSWASMGGRKPITFVTEDDGMLLSVDADTGVDYWKRLFDSRSANPRDCAGGISSGAVRNMALVPAATGASRGGGFGPAVRPPFHAVAGEPGEGIARELMGQTRPPSAPAQNVAPSPAPAPGPGRGNDAPPGRSTAVVAGRGGRGPQGLYLVAPDGVLHIVGENSGLDVQKPVPFLSPGEHPTALSIVDGFGYVLTARECGAPFNGMRAIGLAGDTHPVASWESAGPPLGAPAFGTDGTVYVSVGRSGNDTKDRTSNAVVALEPRTLRLKDSFSAADGTVASPPIVVREKDKDLVLVATSDGAILVLNMELPGAARRTAVASSDREKGIPSGLSSHVTEARRHVLMALNRLPTSGAVVSFVMEDDSSLRRSWVSPELVDPAVPVVVADVVFVLSRGRPGSGAANGARLLALDSRTGRPIWNSGSTIAGAAQGSLLVGNSQVYVATRDRVIYAFGFGMDR
jgi:outer membrane protein assembly factor BamB